MDLLYYIFHLTVNEDERIFTKREKVIFGISFCFCFLSYTFMIFFMQILSIVSDTILFLSISFLTFSIWYFVRKYYRNEEELIEKFGKASEIKLITYKFVTISLIIVSIFSIFGLPILLTILSESMIE